MVEAKSLLNSFSRNLVATIQQDNPAVGGQQQGVLILPIFQPGALYALGITAHPGQLPAIGI